MKFEQAFYTRGKESLHDRGTELGIFASSNLDSDFLRKCMSVGSKFNTETTDETGEFVIYADRFQSFVAVGVSPASNADGGIVNKLCHMFIPCEEREGAGEARQPEQYYLPYPFQREFERASQLDCIELEPCLWPEKFSEICRAYLPDRKRMAWFLYKLFPILFDEENLLLIVIDEERHNREEHGKIARELTWLASRLAPGEGTEARQYRRRLSYGVYTRENIGIVHLVYSSDEKLFGNRFYLDRKISEETEIPELYLELADSALNSFEDYQETIRALWNYRESEPVKRDSLQAMRLNRLLDREETISQTDIPYGLSGLIEQSKRNPGFRDLLIRIIPRLETVGSEDLMNLITSVILPELKSGWREDDNRLCEAAERILELLHPRNRNNYKIFLNKLPDNLRARALNHLFCQRDSCIDEDLERVGQPEELMEIIGIYEPLTGNRAFVEQIKTLARTLYFGLNRKERDQVNRVFKSDLREAWGQTVREKIVEGFREFGAAAFLEREMEQLEESFASVYLSEALNSCQDMKNEESQRTLFRNTDRLVSLYGTDLTDEEKEAYNCRKAAWEDECLLRRMSALPLAELAAENTSFEKFPEEWCRSVAACLERKEQATEKTVRSLIMAENIWRKVENEAQRSFKNSVLKACQGNRLTIQCVLAFDLSVWTVVNLHDIDKSIEQYEMIYELTKDKKDQDIVGFDRNNLWPAQKLPLICYRLWRQFYEAEPCQTDSLCDFLGFQVYGEEDKKTAYAFLTALQKKMRERAVRADYANYIRLELRKEEWAKPPVRTPVQRCNVYARLRQETPDFFAKLAEGCPDCEDEAVRKRMEEMGLYDRVTGPLDGMTLEQQDELLKEAKRQFGFQAKEVAALEKAYIKNLDVREQMLAADIEKKRSRISDLETEQKLLEEKNRELETKCGDLEKQNQKLRSEYDNLTESKKLFEQQIRQLKDSLDQMMERYNQGLQPDCFGDSQQQGVSLAVKEYDRMVPAVREHNNRRKKLNQSVVKRGGYLNENDGKTGLY